MNITFRHIENPEIRKGGEGDGRKVTFVASDGTRDSAGTVLNVNGWDLKRFNSNGIIGYQHKVYGGWEDTDNPDNVIGKGFAYVKDGKLMVDVEFEPAEINELADKIYKKILFGSLRAVSVGFVPIGRGQWGKDDEAIDGKNPTYYYAGQQLLEISVVNIPANPNALKKSFIQEAIDAEMKEIREVPDSAAGHVDPENSGDDNEQRLAKAELALANQLLSARVALSKSNK